MNHGAPLRHAAFSPAGDVIATASQDGAIGLWSNTGDSLQTFHGHEGAATHVTFDARGRRVASASADLTARIWTIDRSQPPAVLRGHRKHVRTVRFNADGSAIVTASLDSTARVFVVGQPGDAITLTHGGELRDARFSGDGSRVLTIGEDGRVLRWRVTWAALHDYLAAATAGCLAATDRVRFLGEADDDAADREQACINGRRTSAHEDGV
jgi:WD40 repeat protein